MAHQGFDLQLTRYDEHGCGAERMGDMTSAEVPTGPFTCEIVLQRVRAPRFILEDRQGVTYMVARDYELAYETVLNFASGARLPIKAKLVGELNQRVIIRDAQRRPVRYSGYTQGLVEISNTDGHVIFRGRYYDSRTLQPLMGDDALTPNGQGIVDHWQNGFGEGAYAGHAFSVGAQLIRKGDSMPRGDGRGHID